MRARLRPSIRLLLALQSEQRTGRVIWRRFESERALLLVHGLVVGTEGQPESFLEYLARRCGIEPAALGRIERRVRDLFVPLETEIVQATGLTLEEIVACRRDFTLGQIADFCLSPDDPVDVQFEEGEITIPRAPCQVAATTALADMLTDRVAHGAAELEFSPAALRPTRLFPRLAGIIEPAFPWRLPLPRAGGEPAGAILQRCGADRAVALWLLVVSGLLTEEPSPADRHRRVAALPGLLPAESTGPLARLEAFDVRLREDPFNQEAIEAVERLAAEEGWPELLMDMQERQIAKAPPPQRGYFLLRLAALAEIAGARPGQLAEIVALGRRAVPRDLRLACAEAFEAFRSGDADRAHALVAGLASRRPAAPAGAPPAVEAVAAQAEPQRPAAPEAGAVPAPAAPAAAGAVPAPAAVETAAVAAAAATAPAVPAAPDPLALLMEALRAKDDEPVRTWIRRALPDLSLLRRTAQALLDAARAPDGGGTQHVGRFARALGAVIGGAEQADGVRQADLRADLFLLLADVLAPRDRRGALAAAARAVEAAPEREAASERLERLALECKDPETYVRAYGLVEERVEGVRNRCAFAYRVGKTLEESFLRPDLAVRAYLRALFYEPRPGAVLEAIERVARLTETKAPLVDAYRALARASDGAHRAMWRARLVDLGAGGAVDVEETDWSDVESGLPAAAALAADVSADVSAGLSAGAKAEAEAEAEAEAPLDKLGAGPLDKPAASQTVAEGEASAVGVSAEIPSRLEAPRRPGAIAEAILRATPAHGIPVAKILAAEEAAEERRRRASEEAAGPPVSGAAERRPETGPAAAAQRPGEPPDARRQAIRSLVDAVAAAAEFAGAPPDSDADVSWLDDTVEIVIEDAPEDESLLLEQEFGEEAVASGQAPPAEEPGEPAVREPAPFAVEAPRITAEEVERQLDELAPFVIEPTWPPVLLLTHSRAEVILPRESGHPAAPEAEAPVDGPGAVAAPAAPPAAAEAPPAEERETLPGPLAALTARQVEARAPDGRRVAWERLQADPVDTDALRTMRAAWRSAGRAGAAWVADSILSVFDAAIEPERPATPAAMPVEAVLSHYGPWEARVLHRAMALVWEHSTTTFLQSLAGRQDVWPADQVGPFGGTPLARGVAECTEQLAFFRFQVYRRRRGEATEIVRTRPPSVLVPPSLDPSRPADLATLAVAVAGCLPEHVLATTLGPAERDAVLDGLLTAFGPPGRLSGRIAQRAADVAQDLWHFVPPRTQNLLRAELSGTDLLDPGTWISEVLARRLLLGIRVSRDLRAGLRLGLAIGAGVPADATVTEALFRQALGRSTTLQRVLRTVLSEPFWQTFGG